jgi:hypothetical protein
MNQTPSPRDTACANLNNNVTIKTENNGIKSVVFTTDYRDFKNQYLDKPRYLLTYQMITSTKREPKYYSIDIDGNSNNIVRKLNIIGNLQLSFIRTRIYDPEIGPKDRRDYLKLAQTDKDGIVQTLNKALFIRIIEALQEYCNDDRFNYETFQKAILAVAFLYPKIRLYCDVFPSRFGVVADTAGIVVADVAAGVGVGDAAAALGCIPSGGKKIRKTRKARKARKTRKNKRRRSRK